MSYSSNGDVGYMGSNWKLLGFSSISRCSKTVSQDGAAQPVQLLVTDVYCMDGNRLHVIGGTHAQVGSAYATEVADFSRIEATVAGTNGPQIFEVWGKDGLIYTYGGTTDSRVLATGTSVIHTWMVSQIRDRDNNRIVFTYKSPDSTTVGTTHPVKIEWAATSQGANTWLYKMEFTYGANAWASSYFGNIAGTEVKEQDLLTAITISESGAVRKKYMLTYATSGVSGGKRMTDIKECSDAAASDCLFPAVFQYPVPAGTASSLAVNVNGNPGLANGLFDINADGFADLMYVKGMTGYVRFGSAGGYGAELSTGSYGAGVLLLGFRAGDLVGDGQDRFLVAVPGGNAQIMSWNGSSFQYFDLGLQFGNNSPAMLAPADVTGDGLADAVTLTQNSATQFTLTLRPNLNAQFGYFFHPWVASFYSLTLTPTPPAGRTISGGPTSITIGTGSQIQGYRGKYDADNDGLEDLIVHGQYNACLIGQPSSCIAVARSWSLRSSTGYGVATPVPNDGGYARPADLNGDGCMDSYSPTNAVIGRCDGTAIMTVAGGGMGTVDWNGDGRQDLVSIDVASSSLKFRKFDGSAMTPLLATSIPATSGCQILKADANGDKLEELGCQTATQLYLYYHQDEKWLDQITHLTSDRNYLIFHGDISQGGIYSVDETFAAPRLALHSGVRVVTHVMAWDGNLSAPADYTLEYKYANATTNLHGRGFEGFGRFQVTDSRNGAKHVRTYSKEDFPKTGRLIGENLYQPDGTTPISTKAISYGLLMLDNTINSKRYHVYAQSSEETLYEVAEPGSFGAALNGVPIARTNTNLTPDNFGNATSTSATVTDLDSTSPSYGQQWVRSVSSTFTANDSPGYWCLGLPVTMTVTGSAPGQANIAQTQSFTNDHGKCRVMSEHAGNGSRQVDTSYGHDSFGNVSAVSVQGRNPDGSLMDVRTTQITWGSADGTYPGTGQFPVTVTNPLNHITSRTFNAAFGSLATETDPNSIVVANNQHDAFGRIIRNERAGGTATNWSYVSCTTTAGPYRCKNGDLTEINYIGGEILIASERDTSNNEVRDDWTYFDRIGRPIAQKSRTLSGGYSWQGREYDSFGRVSRQMAPCDASACSIYWTTNTYDLLGRVVSQSRPQSQSVPAPVTTTFGYAGRRQRITDANGKHSTKTMDVMGRMHRSEDHLGYYQQFTYDAAGSLIEVTDQFQNPLFSAVYDYGALAFQTQATDMDLGVRTYVHNSLGELISSTDAKAQTATMAYDKLSRMTSRAEVEGTTTWTWGTSAQDRNIGRLASVSMTGYSESYAFDSVGRLSQQTVNADQSYAINFAYTNQGLLDTLTYPTSTSSTRVKVKYAYQYGILHKVTDWTSGAAGTAYWTVNAKNWSGATTQETLGNSIKTTRAIDAVTGWTTSLQSGVGGGAGRQNESYLHDKVGNVIQRQESNLGLTESFFYDDLYRLTSSTLGSSTNLSVTYDGMGNINSRSDVAGGATWTYDPSRKHAVLSAGGGAYSYDPNGNVVSRNGHMISWSSFNYPTALAGSGESTQFAYGPDRQYYRQIYSGPSGIETTYYIGGVLEKVAVGGTTDWRHYIRAEGQIVAIVSRKSPGTDAVNYVLENNQSSSAVLTNSIGAIMVRESFGAFGLPRNGATWSGAVPSGDQSSIAGISRRGYTGHSMLGQMGLIHMNGRVYDASIGRFLSADPTIPNPGFTQSYNRYAYVTNNPLSYVDPSGFNESENDEVEEVLDEVLVRGHRTCTANGRTYYRCSTEEWRQMHCQFLSRSYAGIGCQTFEQRIVGLREDMFNSLRSWRVPFPLGTPSLRTSDPYTPPVVEGAGAPIPGAGPQSSALDAPGTLQIGANGVAAVSGALGANANGTINGWVLLSRTSFDFARAAGQVGKAMDVGAAARQAFGGDIRGAFVTTGEAVVEGTFMAAGGALGSFLGPVGTAGGSAIGGVAGIYASPVVAPTVDHYIDFGSMLMREGAARMSPWRYIRSQ